MNASGQSGFIRQAVRILIPRLAKKILYDMHESSKICRRRRTQRVVRRARHQGCAPIDGELRFPNAAHRRCPTSYGQGASISTSCTTSGKTSGNASHSLLFKWFDMPNSSVCFPPRTRTLSDERDCLIVTSVFLMVSTYSTNLAFLSG